MTALTGRRAGVLGVAIAANLLVDVTATVATIWSYDILSPSPLLRFHLHAIAFGFTMGCLFAQVMLLAIATTLPPESRWVRTLWAMLVLVFGIYCLLGTGILMQHFGYWLPALSRLRPGGFHERVLGWFFVFVVFLGLQWPGWVLRKVLQIRIVGRSDEFTASRSNAQFTLLQMFSLTALFAIPLGLGLGLSSFFDEIIHLAYFNNATLTTLVLFFGSYSAAFGLLATWSLLGSSRLSTGLLLLAIMSGLFVLVGTELWMLLQDAGRTYWGYRLLAFASFQAGLLAVALGNGLPARCLGYRLVWRSTAASSRSGS